MSTNGVNKKDYRKFFTNLNIYTWVFACLGFIGSVIIILSGGGVFNAVAVFFLVAWTVAFLRYFFWSVYHYNINYGLTERDWDNIEEAKQKWRDGEAMMDSEIKEPEHNPFRSQTFGLPPGTVRGMIAFSLLFGAFTLLIVSMGMDTVDFENSLIRDQFEFFKTAFLMMIAFYFGDKSLKFLQRRWQTPGKKTGKDDSPEEDTPNENNVADAPQVMSELKQDDIDLQIQQGEYDDTDENNTKKSNTAIKDALNLSIEHSVLEQPIEVVKPAKTRIPIIDAGHGGLDEDGNYITKNAKQYKFTGEEQNGLEIFEGVINRKIAQKLIEKLDKENMAYYDLNSTNPDDMSLMERVNRANTLYKADKSYYFLSIHSNSASSKLSGTGTTAHGFEIFTSVGTTSSDLFAKIAAKAYKDKFPNRRFRGIKEKNYYVLRKTHCPAFLVENLFFDNYEEAQYLQSEEGQQAIADCLFEALKNIT